MKRANRTGRRELRKKRRRVLAVLTAVLAAAAAVTAVTQLYHPLERLGLGRVQVFEIGGERCSPKDARVILLNYQKEYATEYGINMWDHDYGSGADLETYVRDLTLAQLAQVYTLDVIAAEQDVSLSEDEEQLAARAAGVYYDALSKEEKGWLDVSRDDVEKLYCRYALAQKLYASLNDGVEQEVSDDEARVMEVHQIYTADAGKAEAYHAQLESGAEFDVLAASANESGVFELTVNRSTYEDAAVVDALFSLRNGEYTQVLPVENGYAIFYCVNSFDEELTQAHKADVREQRMEELVNSTYYTYTENLSSTLNEEVWNNITMDLSLELEGEAFLSVYEEVFQ